jgi:hypothetical protein
MDTCCIDKSSSAELSEAINSMFAWYRHSRICYAYLSDVPSLDDLSLHREENSAFRLSKWFTRGWTLQELLAPVYLVFYDQEWNEIGTKSGLKSIVQTITGIQDLPRYGNACIAQKISWASNRETTRIEDQAYSLLGIFGVNMPLLYGEGPRAFMRLQLEIIKDSDDDSIFAWFDKLTPGPGLLASSVSAFKSSGGITRLAPRPYTMTDKPYTMTNKGLHVSARLFPSETFEEITGKLIDDVKDVMLLNCGLVHDSSHVLVGLNRLKTDEVCVSYREYIATTQEVEEVIQKKVRKAKMYDIYILQHTTVAENIREQGSIVMLQHDRDFESHWHMRGRDFDPQFVNEYELGRSRFGLAISPTPIRHAWFLARLLFETLPTSKLEVGAAKFAVVLACENGRLGVGIRVAQKDEEGDFMWEALLQKVGIWDDSYSHDRVSERLHSGETVSLALKPTAQFTEIQSSGIRGVTEHCYVLEIKIQEGGQPQLRSKHTTRL